MVVTVEAQATRVGVDALRTGGNAVDAAVAVTFALAVTHPSAGNLGGGGFWLIHVPPDDAYSLDFRETAPSLVDRSAFELMLRSGGGGPLSVGIPGTVAGIFEAHRRFGRLPWNLLVEGATRLALQGHLVSPGTATALRKAWSSLTLNNNKVREQLVGRGQRAPTAGELARRLALGRTLETIGRLGRDGFYQGKVAESIVAALGPGATLTVDDLARYQPRWREPRQLRFRGLLVKTMPLPSAGGAALTEELTMLQQHSLSRVTYGSAEHLHLLLEIERRGDHDRLLTVTDPDRLSDVQLRLLETRYLDPDGWKMSPIDPRHASTSLSTLPLEAITESDNTTHFSIVDANRMIVSATVTLSAAFGSGIATDTGIILNNTLASFARSGANEIHSGQRTVSSMAPTLVYDSNGPVLVLGTPGGDTISSTLLEVLSNLVDFDLPLSAAVDAPRVHQSYYFDRATFEAARPIRRQIRQRLQAMGHVVVPKWRKQGDVKCVLLTDDAMWGYSDSREGGLALAP